VTVLNADGSTTETVADSGAVIVVAVSSRSHEGEVKPMSARKPKTVDKAEQTITITRADGTSRVLSHGRFNAGSTEPDAQLVLRGGFGAELRHAA